MVVRAACAATYELVHEMLVKTDSGCTNHSQCKVRSPPLPVPPSNSCSTHEHLHYILILQIHLAKCLKGLYFSASVCLVCRRAVIVFVDHVKKLQIYAMRAKFPIDFSTHDLRSDCHARRAAC
eukprot:COSAG05_NODE_561_length_8675_cov_3.694846_13_plen_123_part_00